MLASAFGALRPGSLRLASVRSTALGLQLSRQRSLSTVAFPRYQKFESRFRNARWNSTSAAAASADPTPLPPPADALDVLPDPSLVTEIVSLPPIQHGDLQALGLCHWTPAGLIQYSFELTHVLTGLPWFHTFVVATIFWRLVSFPFMVVGTRNSQRLRPIAGELGALQAKVAMAQRQNDMFAMQQASLAAKKLREEHNVSMVGMLGPIFQLPISFGMFFGIKKMCELPVPQLAHSGFEWLPDLTQPAPWILPGLCIALGNLMITVGRRDMDPTKPQMGHMMNGFRLVTFLGFFWLNAFPSGLVLTIFITSLTAILQSLLFRVPFVRAALGIPQYVPPPPGSPPFPSMLDTFRVYILRRPDTAAAAAKKVLQQQPQKSGVKSLLASAPSPVKAYVPPSPPTPPPVPAVPRTLEALAAEAHAKAAQKQKQNPKQKQLKVEDQPAEDSSSLFEDVVEVEETKPRAPSPKKARAAANKKAKGSSRSSKA
ncbi:60Kd inner membrane protein-domain-containing protein [Roridomyces roridus]|uniref:60Kd inner membrane protein-domain-containing protein n=1 Tax=Roridomyces roridus TaxID=1738132 RepID=A0AAD7B1A7_9AGAR|nr:60Kd inner membrane protein-domain-containing protein [Roridomyces roridus]